MFLWALLHIRRGAEQAQGDVPRSASVRALLQKESAIVRLYNSRLLACLKELRREQRTQLRMARQAGKNKMEEIRRER